MLCLNAHNIFLKQQFSSNTLKYCENGGHVMQKALKIPTNNLRMVMNWKIRKMLSLLLGIRTYPTLKKKVEALGKAPVQHHRFRNISQN